MKPAKKRGRPAKPKDELKSGHKSLRIRSRVQFAIEFWARSEGQSETEFIEAACEAHADALAKRRGYAAWRKLWHSSEGVRWLRIYALENYPIPDIHEKRRDFVMMHREFFYDRGPRDEVIVNELRALALLGGDEDQPFARLDAFRKSGTGAGLAMVNALEAAGIAPPVWPPR